MMKMKKMFTMLLLLLVAAGASAKVHSGTFKAGGTWKLDTETGELYVDAEKVPDYNVWSYTHKYHEWFWDVVHAGKVDCDLKRTYEKSDAPWWKYRADIKTIRFSSKVKRIGKSAFAALYDEQYHWDKEEAKKAWRHYTLSNSDYGWIYDRTVGLESVTFDGNTPVEIDMLAFASNRCLEKFDFKSVTKLSQYTFNACPYLESNEFPALTSLYWTSLPNNENYYKRGVVVGDKLGEGGFTSLAIWADELYHPE